MINMGVRGIVIGGLTSEGKLDLELVEKIQQEIPTKKYISITFHKAFDHQTTDIV